MNAELGISIEQAAEALKTIELMYLLLIGGGFLGGAAVGAGVSYERPNLGMKPIFLCAVVVGSIATVFALIGQ